MGWHIYSDSKINQRNTTYYDSELTKTNTTTNPSVLFWYRTRFEFSAHISNVYFIFPQISKTNESCSTSMPIMKCNLNSNIHFFSYPIKKVSILTFFAISLQNPSHNSQIFIIVFPQTNVTFLCIFL